MEDIIIDEVEMNEINNRNQRSSRARSCSSGRERARGLSPEAHVAHLRFLELRRAELIQTYSSNNNILNFTDTPGTSTTTMDELTPMWASIAELTESYNNDGYIPNFMQMEHTIATPTHYPSSMVEEIVPWQLPVAPLEPLPPVAEELPENFHDYDYLEAPPTPPTLLELNVLQQQQQQQQQQQIIIDDNVSTWKLFRNIFLILMLHPQKRRK
ncbi:unnamed protein product [Meloidogyne enterolobii]|uniref:Uncharacterized protein n=1 Tax=Meloidogyne enterolobii TaxID=390850 RepID=A0ACB0ZX00_MELEN